MFSKKKSAFGQAGTGLINMEIYHFASFKIYCCSFCQNVSTKTPYCLRVPPLPATKY